MKEHIEKIEQIIKINRHNKFRTFSLVIVVLVFSFVLLLLGICNYPSINLDTKTTELVPYERTVATLEKSVIAKQSVPMKVTEKYQSTVLCLLFICVLTFISLSVWGAFTILFKVLKNETDLNMKILDVHKDLYKEKVLRNKS